jgi:hypothetical protein
VSASAKLNLGRLTALLLAAACSQSAREAGSIPEWVVDSIPELDVASTASGERVLFEHPGGATRLTRGTIAIGDRTGSAVIIVDLLGNEVHRVGRRGMGPGEFQSVNWIGQCRSDSVFVWDAPLGRITVIDSSGSAVRQYDVPHAFDIACNHMGTLALLTWLPGPPIMVNGVAKQAGTLMIENDRGETVQTLGTVPLFEGMTQPLSPTTSLAVSGAFVYVGTQDSAFVDAYPIDGRVAIALPVQTTRRLPSRAQFEYAVDALLSWTPQADIRQQVRTQMLAEIPMPDLLPPYADVITDADGGLWVQTSFPGEGLTQLRLISPSGEVVANITLPHDVHVFEIGSDYVLGSYEDLLGEPHVVLYRLHRSRSRRDAG